ncbi:MAG TPA: FHA domain-containing protein [Anaeromyxobacter sp.]|nr:FHA domain-containing protein [Anaeromyxobacter sp.]
MRCKSCGSQLDSAEAVCPRCGAGAELGRLTGILGIVCRRCDAYNEPGTEVCTGCGKPLFEGGKPPPPEPPSQRLTVPAPGPFAPLRAAAAPVGKMTSAGQPVVRSFQRVARTAPPSQAPRSSPASLLMKCPRCGAEASAGTFCPRCGQGLGSRGTQFMAPVGEKPRAVPETYVELAPGRAKLILERGAGREGESYKLDAPVTEVGRTRGAILFPDDPTLSAHHASFLFRNGSLHVRDEGAPGGIHLRLRGLSIPLKPGDHLVVGDRLLRYAGPLPPAAPPPPPPEGTRLLGAPRPAGSAVVLEEVLEGGATGRVFVRPGPSVTIGRAGCAVNLGEDPYLSQAHAELLVDASGGVRVRDLGSSNGTFARLPPRSERELRDADVVRMGREVLRVSVIDGAASGKAKDRGADG